MHGQQMAGLINSYVKVFVSFQYSFSWCNMPYQKLWKLSPKIYREVVSIYSIWFIVLSQG